MSISFTTFEKNTKLTFTLKISTLEYRRLQKNQRMEKEWNRKVIISRHTLCLSFEYPIFLDAAAFTDRIWRVGSRFFTVS